MKRRAMKSIGALWAICVAAAAATNDSDAALVEEEVTPRQRHRLRCNRRTQQICTKCSYAEDGTPTPEHYCADKTENCPVSVCCNIATEETCYDPVTGDPTSCAKFDEGGCPCPEGEVKCGVSEHSSGYCTKLCCDWATEKTCYDAEWEPVMCIRDGEGRCPKRTRGRRRQRCNAQTEQVCTRCAYSEDGSPAPERYCAAKAEDCPVSVCCDIQSEETCYDPDTGDATSCAKLDEGGCPCPEGEVKCGVSEYSSGYCTKLCCDWNSEETCYDEDWEPIMCVERGEECPASYRWKSQMVRVDHVEDDEGDEEFDQVGKRTFRRGHPWCNPQTERSCIKCAYHDDGAPFAEHFCVDKSDECPEVVCCDLKTEEACYDETTGHATSCASLDDGGCPCPEGEVKCGASLFSSGYCTTLCCDAEAEETCYDESGEPYCTKLCCDAETTEEICYDEDGEPIWCRKAGDKPCPKRKNPPPAVVGLRSQAVRIDYSDNRDAEEFNEPT